MKKILFILLLTIPFVGFGQNDTLKNYHKNGQLSEIGIWKDGKKEGLWKYYYQDGFLEKTINYKNGLFNGLWINYSINENNELIRDESTYINGQREGVWKYYIDNTLIKEGYLKNEMRNKIWKYYHYNGKLKKETKWKNDKEIYSRYWDENGNDIKKETYYKHWGVNGNKIDNNY